MHSQTIGMQSQTLRNDKEIEAMQRFYLTSMQQAMCTSYTHVFSSTL